MRTILRDMQLTDLDQVGQIERVSFPTAWSTLTYIYEIKQNPTTYMGVLEMPNESPPKPKRSTLDRLQLIMRPFRPEPPKFAILAYGGVWVRVGEAHISTIASHQDYRGSGYGELMLVGLLARGMTEGAEYAVLEVRVSNIVAQRLYKKYGFVKTAVIPKYYHDNREDAYLMKIPRLNDLYLDLFRTNVEQLVKRIEFEDVFSGLRLNQLDL